jgi:Rieske Fe-S protein
VSTLLGADAFPSTIPDADGAIDRRSFFEQGVRLAALAALVGAGACTVHDPTAPTSTNSGPVTVKLTDYPALLQSGGVARISGVSPPVAVVNLDGSYKALSLVCPHAGAEVQWGGQAFVCPRHGATFAEDGTWEGGQHTSNLREYACTFDADAGTVTIQP